MIYLSSHQPMHVLFCNDSMTYNKPAQCPDHTRVPGVTPGSVFQVSAFITGQRHCLVSGLVDAECLPKDTCNISKQYYYQYYKVYKKKAAILSYVVSTPSASREDVRLKLVTEDYYSGYSTYRYKPSVHIEVCSLGFMLENKLMNVHAISETR